MAAVDDPKPGFFRRRLVKGGPFVPVRIWLEQPTDAETGELIDDAVLRCIVDGRDADPVDQWSYCCDQPITEQEYDYMWKLSDYARVHDRREPSATPRKKIDPLGFRLPTFERQKGKKP